MFLWCSLISLKSYCDDDWIALIIESGQLGNKKYTVFGNVISPLNWSLYKYRSRKEFNGSVGGEQFCTWSDFKNPDWFVPECSVLLTSWTAFQWQQILFSPISLFPEGSTIVLLILFVPSLLTRRRFPYLRAPRREDRIIALTSLTCHPAAFQSCSTITYFDPSIWCHNVSIIITYRYIEKQYSLRRKTWRKKKRNSSGIFHRQSKCLSTHFYYCGDTRRLLLWHQYTKCEVNHPFHVQMMWRDGGTPVVTAPRCPLPSFETARLGSKRRTAGGVPFHDNSRRLETSKTPWWYCIDQIRI